MTGESAAGRPDDRLPSVLRFTTELVAWVATPWALAGCSWLLAVLSVVVLAAATVVTERRRWRWLAVQPV